MHREAIRRTLALYAGDAPDANAFAEAAVETWRQIAAGLAALIGERGVDALLRRSLHLTSNALPWLVIAENDANRASLLNDFKAQLERRETATAEEASYALLMTIAELLETLIGESLTERYLGAVWAPRLRTDAQETVS